MYSDGAFCVEGITFNVSVVLGMKKREFVDMHKRSFFLDRELSERERMLSDIYDRIKDSREGVADSGIV